HWCGRRSCCSRSRAADCGCRTAGQTNWPRPKLRMDREIEPVIVHVGRFSTAEEEKSCRSGLSPTLLYRCTKLIGSTARPCFSTSKCRCGPVERPVEPICAIGC